MSANVERVLNEIRALTPEEQKLLRAALDKMPMETPKPQMTEEEFERRMEEGGIISRPQVPTLDTQSFDEFKPIEILDDKPISETIIEERR
jgi:hypothetical protein